MKGYGNFESLTKHTMSHYPKKLLTIAHNAQRHPVTIKNISKKIINQLLTEKEIDKLLITIEDDVDNLLELRKLLLFVRKKK